MSCDPFGLNFLTFEVGETCHIWMPGHRGQTTEGKVVAILDLPGWSVRNYVIEIPTYIDPLLEVRDGIMGMFKSPVGHEP